MRIKLSKEVKKQKDFFDREKYQYSKSLLVNPPFHTQLEIEAITKRIPKINKDDEVLDFGAGSGRISIALLKRNIPVHAIDVSTRSLEVLKNTAQNSGLTGLRTSSEFPKGKLFSVIVGADILHHVSLETYLPIFYKSLKGGGKIIFSEPNAFNPFWYVILPIRSSWEIEKGMLACRRNNLIRLLKESGFSRIQISGQGLFPGPIFNTLHMLCIANDKSGNLPILNTFSYRLLIEAIK